MPKTSRYDQVLEFTRNSKGQVISSTCRVCKHSPTFTALNGYRHANKKHLDLIEPRAATGRGRARAGRRHHASTATAAASLPAAAGPDMMSTDEQDGPAEQDDADEPADDAAAAAAPPSAPVYQPDVQMLEADDSTLLTESSSSSELSTDASDQDTELPSAYDADESSLDSEDSLDTDMPQHTWDDGSAPPSEPPQPAKEGSAEWYRQLLDRPLYQQPAGSLPGPTARTVLESLMVLKLQYHMSDTGIDATLRLLHSWFPSGNGIPPSFYLAKKVMGVQTWRDVEVHLCAAQGCPGHIYDRLEPKQYEAHAMDCCPLCQHLRFERVTSNGRSVLQPFWPMLWFGLDKVVQQFHCSPDWVAALHAADTPTSLQQLDSLRGLGSLFGGTEMKRLATTEPRVLARSSGLMDICVDWINPFAGVQNSVGVLGASFLNVDPARRGSKANQQVLGVIFGPSIPKNFRPYLLPAVRDFNLYSSPDRGIQVRQLLQHEDGTVEVRNFTQFPFLVGCHADKPARDKCAAYPGAAAALGCGFCQFQASRLPAPSGKLHSYPEGYSTPVPQTQLFEGQRMLSDDPRLQLDHREHMRRGTAVQTGQLKAQAAGCTGLSAFAGLHTFDYCSFFVLPVIHMLLYGVVSDVLKHILHEPGSKGQRAAAAARLASAEAAAAVAAAAGGPGGDQAAAAATGGDDGGGAVEGTAAATPAGAAAANVGVLSAAKRREVKRRLTEIYLTSDFSSPPKDITAHLSSMKMEDLLVFVEVVAAYMFSGEILPKEAAEPWHCLRAAVLHYCRPPSEARPFTAAARSTAHANMLRYAQLLEQYGYPSYMKTWNLHYAVRHLPEQEERRGPTGADAEWWSERTMQLLKELTGGRASRDFEKVFANALLFQHAVNLQRLDSPSMPTALESCHGTAAPRQGPTYDPGNSDKSQLLGSGTRLQRGLASQLLNSLQEHAEQLGPGWDSARLAAAFAAGEPGSGVYSYLKADTGRELVSTATRGKPGGRQNCYVQISMPASTEDSSSDCDGASSTAWEPWVGEVQHLLLLRDPNVAAAAAAAGAQEQQDPDDDLRVAVLRLFSKPDAEQAEQLLGSSWQLLCVDMDPNSVVEWLFPVPLSCIEAKLVVFMPQSGPWFFSRYTKTSCVH